MKHPNSFKLKKKINYNRANLKRIRDFHATHPSSPPNLLTPASLSLTLLPIPKFLNPIKIHRLPGDLILEDRASYSFDGELTGCMSDYSLFKKVVSIHYEGNFEILSIGLMNYNNDYSSGELLVSRLRSVGLETAKTFSDVIENYIKMNQFQISLKKKMKKEPSEKNKYQAFLNKKNQMIKSLNQKNEIFLITDFNVNEQSETMQVFRFHFSKILLNLLFNSITDAMHYISQQGFPDYLAFKFSYYETFLTILNQIYFNKSTEPIEMNLILKNHEKIAININFIKDFYLEEQYMEGFLIQVLVPKKMIKMKENCENLRYIVMSFNQKKYEKESAKFLEKIFGKEEKEICDEEDEKKRCKFKEI